mmetsp:Transcript_16518/g.23108  ORF Transcript_16518/g.23108 Transcript_16518/m.23108 type:complete len:2184 (+) Transcript_16518:275-6826(+)|eukprot:CAMPEP_0184488188 /NCGR_PEP_ID=MMETSP0113_2-20130426/10578_1 /TAXON_ID=91329 /ORGANISM="Norrisiella sphaerica, Strain BC52" /LENGTH=2183 /DNA_ID=CAMNT_0026870683 /DNA_START=275 /DNA_END=6826 /DNA_ORIENTATION=-
MVLVSTPNDFRNSYIPLLGAVAGVLLCLLGSRAPRLWNSLIGIGVGWAGTMWFVTYDTTWDQVPIVLSILGSLCGGLVALVLGPTVAGITAGYCVAVLVIVLTNEQLFTINNPAEAAAFIIALCLAGLIYSLYRPKSSIVLASAGSGALLSATCIDIYGEQNFYHISTMFTIFKLPGVHLPRTCDITCFYMLLIWGMLAAWGLLVQLLMHYLVPMDDEMYKPISNPDHGTVWEPLGNRSNQSHLKRAQLSYGALSTLNGMESLSKGEASYNYLATEDMPDPMRALSGKLGVVFNKMQKQFGFQQSNKRNQQEHLLMLIYNAISRVDMDNDSSNLEYTPEERETLAVQKVHDKLYRNYRDWCRHLRVQDDHTRGSGNAQERVQIENMALMLLVWGEAALMRHCPESLCYITYNMLKELRTRKGHSLNREPGSFLDYVIRPVYMIFRNDNGDIHTKRRNYDDVNEFFWGEKCLDYAYCEPDYTPGTHEDSKDGERETLAMGLQSHSKTYMETRSWWHVVLTFYPLIMFYVVSFHILVCMAWVLHWDAKGFGARSKNNVIMVSFLVTLSIMSLLREFLEMYVRGGKSMPGYSRIGSTCRIMIKLGFALLISFYYYRMVFCTADECQDAWFRYMVISALYLLPLCGQVLTLMFPIVGRCGNSIFNSHSMRWFTDTWWPIKSLYVGRNIGERDVDYYKYQLFWVLLLAWKMVISYNFQVVPCLNPTLWIWAQFKFFSLATRITMILITWLPFFVVYIFDMYIWYAVVQGVCGLVVGMRDKVGQIHQFSLVSYLFSEFPGEVGEKLFQTKKPDVKPVNMIVDNPEDAGENGVQLDSKTYTSYGSIEDDEMSIRVQKNWRRFAIIWNEMINDLRQADLMSNQEQFVFEFRLVDLPNPKARSFQTPLFVSTSSINASINFIASNAAAFNSAIMGREDELLDSKSSQILASFIDYFSQTTRRESITDLWNLAMTLVFELSPSNGHEALANFQHIVEGLAYPRREHPYSVLFRILNLDKVASLKPKLLMLVRGARLARTAWKKYRAKKHKQRQRNSTSSSPLLSVSVSRSSSGTFNIHKSPSLGTLKLKDKLEKQQMSYNSQLRRKKYHPDVEKHLSLLRGQLRDLLIAMVGLIKRSHETGRHLEQKLDELVMAVDKAFGMGEDHMHQLDDFLLSVNCDVVLNSLYTFLTVSNEFTPKNSSARRRILFFCNSLFMDIPDAPPISQMHSLTTLTPFYSEDVLYSKAYLQNKTKQGFSVLLYLQTVYPSEWENFCERMGIKTADASILDWATPELQMESRLWATRRGQTLFRTVDGMMMYEKAIKVLAELERIPQIASDLRNTMEGKPMDNHSSADAKGVPIRPDTDILSCLKYQYVVSCQVYGKQKEESDPKANDIEFLLHRFSNLRVAYIDNKKEEGKGGQTQSKYYSVLIKGSQKAPGDMETEMGSPPATTSTGSPKDGGAPSPISLPTAINTTVTDEKGIVGPPAKSVAQQNAEADDEWDQSGSSGGYGVETVYRVELPGNPIIGEGKPENQNHAIIFTRGEFVQTIDMNQEGYFEEAVKMRNLLEEFDKPDSRKPTTIVGLREHIFTGGLSSVANYMAMQEGCFVTLGQRVLHDPLKIRLHYGHPDVFDKLFYLGRGGVSKASKGINLSEDIFAGFNTVLRGGHVSFKEYITVGKGRDVGLQQLFQFEGKLSCGNAMQSLTRDMYRICRSVDFLKLLSFFYGGIGFYISTLLAVWGLYAFCYQRVFISALNLSLPKSFIGIDTVGYWIGTMGVLLTVPIICAIGLERGAWKATCKVMYMLLSGGPLFFMFHMGTKAHYFARTILAGGAKYRPTGRGFVADHTKFAELFRFYHHSHFQGAVEMIILLIIYGIFDRRVKHYWAVTWCAWVIVLSWLFAPLWLNPMEFDWEQVVNDTKDFAKWMGRPEGSGDRCWKTWFQEENMWVDRLPSSSKVLLGMISLRHTAIAFSIFWYCGVGPKSPIVLGCASIMIMLVGYYSISSRQVSGSQLCFFRGLKSVYVTVAISIIVILVIVSPPHKETIKLSGLVLLALTYLLATFSSFCLSFGYRFVAVQQLSRLYDYIVGLSLMGTVALASLLVVPAWIQTRLLFHNAFSKGVLIDDLLRGGQNKNSPVDIKATDMGRGRSRSRAFSSYQNSWKPPTGRSQSKSKGKPKSKGSPLDLPEDTSLISKSS